MTSDSQDPNKLPASRPGTTPSSHPGGKDPAIPTLTTTMPPGSGASADEDRPFPSAAARSAATPDPSVTADREASRHSAAARPGVGAWPWLLLLLLIVTAAVASWLAQERFHSVELDGEHRVREVADKTQTFDGRIRVAEEVTQQVKAGLGDVQSRVGEVQNQLQSRLGDVQSTFTELQNRFGAIDGKLAETAGRQDRIEALYNDIIKARSTSALADVQQSVAIATRYLQLHNNVPGAIAILEDGAQVLQAADPADSTGVRKLILGDIEKLRAVPAVDLNALVVRLDHVLDNVGKMPLMAETDKVPGEKIDLGAGARPGGQGPDSAATPPTGSNAPAATAGPGAWDTVKGWFDQALDAGSRGVDAARDQLKDAVAIQKVDQPDLLLLAPQQRDAARDNLRLMLLNARLDLLNRRQELFHTDVSRAAQGIRQLFDMRNADVKAAVAALDQLKTAVIDVPIPSLADTAAAITSLKSPTEKR